MKLRLFPILSILAAGAAGLILFASSQIPRNTVIDSAALLNDLRILSADDMQGRRTGTAGSARARTFIAQRFKASGISPFGSSYEQPFTFGRGISPEERGVNLIGFINGKVEPRKYIVITAHYDHLGMANGVVFNGADDNASGTAALFSIARYFSSRIPRNSLIFAAFDAEELGHHGSQAFVKKPPVDVRALYLNLNLDMIARAPDRKLFVVGTALQPYLRPSIETVAKRAKVRLLTGHEDPAQPEDWTRDSDHFSFMQAKIPALYFGVEDFDQHHRATDDYETITAEFYVQTVETLIEVIEEFDANLGKVDSRGKAR